jgi:tRNA(adenine34) deaminase
MTAHRIMPSPPPSFSAWDDVMREAVIEARKAAKCSEIPVGAVIVSPAGSIIGRGHNAPLASNDPTAHAEIMAIRAAAAHTGNYLLNNCVMAVTLEPCLMCVGAIVYTRLAGVVFGAVDQKAGAVLSKTDGFELASHNHVPWQAGGILEEECAALLRDFFAARRGK